MKEPRPYQVESDLAAMQKLLTAGRKANNGTYYIHTGDLSWWLYYPPLDRDFWDQIYLWDDPGHPGKVLGWALLSPDWVGIDVYIQPELKGSNAAWEMYMWAEERAGKIARENGKSAIHMLWVLHGDEVLGGYLKQHGFRLGRGYVQLARNLNGDIPAPLLPDGFSVRSCMGVNEVGARAHAQYGAFNSSASFERYLERFRRFMLSPAYNPELDIVAASPGGGFGAFCIAWPDPVNRVGLFEPVGTHPDFQRRGLGRAVMLEGLRRLQQNGMRTAIVSVFEDNYAAIKLYESVGFQVVARLGTYEKDV